MATLAQIFNRAVLLSYVAPDPLKNSPLVQSGAFVSDDRLRPLLTSGAKTFEVPYINGIDPNLEPNYSNTIVTDVAEGREIEAGSMMGRIAFLNEGFLESNLGRYLSQVNALEIIGGLIDGMWQGVGENRARATVTGLRNYDWANGKKITYDISKTSSANEASGFSVDAFVDSEATMSRGMRGNGVIFVHSQIAAKMRKQNLIEKLTYSSSLPPVDVYNGRVVIETDFGTKIGTGVNAQYVSILASNGAFSYDSVPGPKDLTLDESQSTGNGGGHDRLWTRRNVLIQPQGFSFVAPENTLTGGTKNEALSASWGDLQKAENWEMVNGASAVPFRFLITNL